MNVRLLALALLVATTACRGNGSGIYEAVALAKIYGQLPVLNFLRLQSRDAMLRREYAAGLLTKWSSSTLGVPDKAPNPRTDIRQIGVLRSYLDATAIAAFNANFPEGHGTYAWRYSAMPSATLNPGFYTFAYMNLRANAPMTVEDRHFQYAFVWDRDGDRGNNYQGSAPFDRDFFNGSDTWFQFRKQPNLPWTFTAQNARGGSISNWVSEAIMLACDDVLLMMLPDDEYEDMIYSAKFRATAFEHGGDFGQAAPHDWFGSVRPERDTFLFGPNWSAIQKYEPQVRIESRIVQASTGYLSGLGITVDPLAMYADFDGIDFPVRSREDIDLVLRNSLLGGISAGYQFVPRNLPAGYLTTRAGISTSDVFTGWTSLPGPGSFAVADKDAVPFTGTLSAGYSIPFLSGAVGVAGEAYGKIGTDTLWTSVSTGAGATAFTAPVLNLYDGQRTALMLDDRTAELPNLEANFRSAVETAFPSVTTVRTGPTLDVQSFVRGDLKVSLIVRLDTRGVGVESHETITVSGVGSTKLEVPFLAHGRTMKDALVLNSGETLLIGGVQDVGQPSMTEGVPFLANIPVLDRLFAPPRRTDDSKKLFVLVRPTLVMPAGF
ncbi:MAG: hypothetical protein HZB39_05925 [Planctomycetes bacterium]|nr:hypothetical protein [Planctomycetota bacterium]